MDFIHLITRKELENEIFKQFVLCLILRRSGIR